MYFENLTVGVVLFYAFVSAGLSLLLTWLGKRIIKKEINPAILFKILFAIFMIVFLLLVLTDEPYPHGR